MSEWDQGREASLRDFYETKRGHRGYDLSSHKNEIRVIKTHNTKKNLNRAQEPRGDNQGTRRDEQRSLVKELPQGSEGGSVDEPGLETRVWETSEEVKGDGDGDGEEEDSVQIRVSPLRATEDK